MPLGMSPPEDRPGGADISHRRTLVRSLPLMILATLAILATALVEGADIDEDTVIEGPTVWSESEYVITANITVADGGSLTINGSTLTFGSSEGVVNELNVEPGGELVLTGVTASASESSYVIFSEGDLTITGCTLSDLYYTIDDETLSNLHGGVIAASGSLTVEDVEITSDGLGLSAYGCDLSVDGLTVVGGQYGIQMAEVEGTLSDVTVTDMIMAFVIGDSTVTLVDASVERVNWTLWAVRSHVTVTGMDSRPYGDHLAFENGTSLVEDSYFYDGQEGVVALLGYMEVVGCHFNETRTAIELLYAEGRVADTLVEGCADMSIVLSFVGFTSEEPRLEFDNVTVRDGAEAALDIDSTSGVTVQDVTIEGCGDGINVASSEIVLRDIIITGSTQCREWGCSYKATGTGILVETSSLELIDVTIEDSNGPAVSSYWSLVNATRCAFVDGNASGIMLVYSALDLQECQVSGNAGWGVESLGFDIDPEELDATWGNDLADIRMNMTVNARVVDQDGKWLSHANVTASSQDLSYGPYPTGFEGRTQTYELAILEWTDGGPEVDYNPWTFTIEYGDFTNTTDVEIVLGLGEITLVVNVLRADLYIVELDSPKEAGRDDRTRIDATVGNQGNYTVKSVILTFYYRDSNGFQRVIGEARIGPIEPGGEETGRITWVPDTRGKYTIVAFVDVDDHVDEEDDDNNRAEKPLAVVNGSSDAPGPGATMALAVLGLALLASWTARRREL